MSHATITTEMCFSDPLRQQLVDSGADAVWPLDDTFGSTVREIVQNLTGTSDDVSRSDAGFIPEYGSVSGFNGTTSTFYVETDAALEPSATVAVAFLVKLLSAPAGSWSLVRKENAGVGGRISVRIVISGADTILRFTANIGATSRDLDYTIADVAAWQATARMIICRYDGTNMQIIQVTLAGVKSTLATAAYSGVVANGTPSRLYVGSNAATDEYANVQLQWLTWWSDDYPTDAELTAMGVALGWTDVSDDVNLGHGLELTYGIQSEGTKAPLWVRVQHPGAVIDHRPRYEHGLSEVCGEAGTHPAHRRCASRACHGVLGRRLFLRTCPSHAATDALRGGGFSKR